MSENGAAGFAVAPDGDIEAVFANRAAGAPAGTTKSMIPQAIANGGTKLDCYGEGLVRLYIKYGFIPVARTKFDPQYANPGWDPSKGTPDIFFMMHNGDNADTVVDKFGTYPIPTKAELEALPEMDYDSAYKYRDKLLAEHTAKGSPLGGAVERSETEGGNSAAKPTDPAEAAVEQEYRRLVENAITEGDYQRAVALYREYNNPALRAYKEFYTLKTFSEYAASQGYIPASETAIGAGSIPSPVEESKRQTLKQEWEEAAPPKEYDGVFDDFTELNLSREENNALRELQSLSASSGYEYCIIIADGKASEPMTSESKNSVGFLLDQYPGRVTLLHSHTNATPPSVSDLRMLLNEKVEKIGSIGYNRDCYIAYNDYGITPSAEEFDIIAKKISDEVNVDLLNYPDFYSWSLSERNYMAIREQAYRIVRYFEWTMEGGRIDE